MSNDPLVTILLPGAPMGKKRHRSRVVTPNGRAPWVQTYPDPAGAAYESALALAGRVAMGARAPFDEALTVMVEAFVPIPASWSAKKQAAAAAGDIPATSKPDGDNYAKIAGDALNKICWVDDSLIVMWQISKQYSDFPRLRVSAWRWDDVPPSEPEMQI